MLVFIAAYLRRSTFKSLRHPEQRRRRVSKDLLRSSFLKRRYHGTAKQNDRPYDMDEVWFRDTGVSVGR